MKAIARFLIVAALPFSTVFAQDADCNSAYAAQFSSWTAYLNGVGGAPSQPTANDACFAQILQAQADAFSAWTASRNPAPAAPDAPPAPPAAPVGTRDNPVPIGQSAQITTSDGPWTITVRTVTPDAASLVRAANQFNRPAASGRQFLMANVEAVYDGAGVAHMIGSFWSAVGPSQTSYTDFTNSCGVINGEFPPTDVFSGGRLTGNICWEVLSSDVGGLVMYRSLGSRGAGPVFFSLH